MGSLSVRPIEVGTARCGAAGVGAVSAIMEGFNLPPSLTPVGR